MILNKTKNIALSIIIISLLTVSSSFAIQKNPYEGEVDEPIASSNVNHSEQIIIDKYSYDVYNPLNPTPVEIDKDEYDKVDNYNVDLKTLNLRIKYFSPTYRNIRQSALSSYTMAYYARGGNDDLVYNAKTYTSDILDLSTSYKMQYEKLIVERNSLSKTDPDYDTKYANLTSQILTYEQMYKQTKAIYNGTNSTINSTKTMLGLTTALYNMSNVDNNAQIKFARDTIEKSLSSAILSYLQLKTYVSILEEQVALYDDMYKLYEKNYELGISTSNDVLNSLSNYEAAKDTLKITTTTMNNVKEQIAINLGYKISDLDKLKFIEPEVDYDFLNSINFEEDVKRAYTSNSNYTSIKISDKDRKLPQSTGEEIYNNMKEYISIKVSSEFENIYNNLLAAKISYDNISYLNDIYEKNKSSNKRKFDNNLVSELEFKGIELQNLSNELQIKTTKYNLINRINDYYYGALGHIDIS